jgi:hypothetical protein
MGGVLGKMLQSIFLCVWIWYWQVSIKYHIKINKTINKKLKLLLWNTEK